MQTLEQIEQEMLEGQLSPADLADKRVTLSALLSRACGELEEILAIKPAKWSAMRKDLSSDKSTTNAWDATEDGIKEMRLRSSMKRMSVLISAISSLLRVRELEAKNLH